MNQHTLHKMIRVFVGYGEPIEEDGQGANKPDWPFFSKIAQQDTIYSLQFEEAAERFYKYRNTQLPRLLIDAGLVKHADQIEDFLDDMRERGRKAKEEKAKQDKKTSLYKGVILDINVDLNNRETIDVDAYIERLTELGLTTNEAKTTVEATKKAWQPPVDLRVHFSFVDDSWTNRWGKTFTTKRIVINCGYLPELNNALKQQLGFPAVKYHGDLKKWSLKNEADTITKAVDIMIEQGLWPDDTTLNVVLQQASSEVSKPPPTKQDITVELIGNSALRLSWPYIADPIMRGDVMGEVKRCQGRKYDPNSKTWSISITEAVPLVERLRKYEDNEWCGKLADEIQKIPDIHTYMEERAKRVAISGAASLSDTNTVEEMQEALAEVFPEGYELYPFQYVGVQFAQLAGGRCLIGDDMGIGKTIQAIAHIGLNQDKLPALIVVPASVKYNWLKECKTWLPSLNTVVLEGRKDKPMTKSECKELALSLGALEQDVKTREDAVLYLEKMGVDMRTVAGEINADIVVCNYDIMSYREDALIDYGFNIVVCDESHYLKNSKAKRTQATLSVAQESESVICLSGTAITNRPNEFFTTLNLLRPNEFPSFFNYGLSYCDGHETRFGWDFSGASNTDELHSRTRDFCIRRLKSEVLTELPDKVRTIHDIQPSKADVKRYKDLHRTWMDEYEMYVNGEGLPQGFVLNMLTALRHECGLIKVPSTVQYIKDYNEITGKPLVVFAHHQDVLKGIWMELSNDKDKKWRLAGISGDMPANKRQLAVEAFQDGRLDVILCSTMAAKEGITLTAADTVVFVEREWVPGWEEQAEDRVNRIGQDSNSVHAVYLSVADTIDERFNMVVEAKRQVVKAVLDGGDMEKREGIANMLIQSMIEAGDLPADFLENMKKKGEKK
tara:strand:- start:8703 stop:11399 length:2697 start_codon:yes stop_codon:yes gene_type:complete